MAKKVKSKSSASKKASSSKKVVQETKPVEEVKATPVEETVQQPPALDEEFSKLVAQLVALRTQLTSVTSQVRALQKRSEREMKAAQKASRKRSKKGGPKQPSGFTKATMISNELATFLGKPQGTEMARTDVTKELQQYILKHNLQDPKNGRHILADKKLQKLLRMKKEDQLTYFNLQKYMKPHFATGGSPPSADLSK